MKTFYQARGALLKNICTHSEPQLDRIMSGILDNGEIRAGGIRESEKNIEIEVKTFF